MLYTLCTPALLYMSLQELFKPPDSCDPTSKLRARDRQAKDVSRSLLMLCASLHCHLKDYTLAAQRYPDLSPNGSLQEAKHAVTVTRNGTHCNEVIQC
jgi:hypothetical protein